MLGRVELGCKEELICCHTSDKYQEADNAKRYGNVTQGAFFHKNDFGEYIRGKSGAASQT